MRYVLVLWESHVHGNSGSQQSYMAIDRAQASTFSYTLDSLLRFTVFAYNTR